MAGPAIYSPQLGTDIDSGLSSLGSLFTPPSAQQLQVKGNLANQQATNDRINQGLTGLQSVNPTIADLFRVGDSDPTGHFAKMNQYQNSQSDTPNITKLDLGNYSINGVAGNTFLGRSQDKLGENEVTNPSPILGVLGIKPSQGVITLGDNQKLLPDGTTVGTPDAPDPEKQPKFGVIGEDAFGNKLYGYAPAYSPAIAGKPLQLQQTNPLTPQSTAPSSDVASPIVSTPLPGSTTAASATANAVGGASGLPTLAGAAPSLGTPTQPGAPASAQPLMPTDPNAPATATASPAAASPTAAPANPTSLHGQDFMKALQTAEPQIAPQVQAIVDGRAPYPTGMMMRTPLGQKLAAYVTQMDPSFDVGNAVGRIKTRNDFLAGGPNSAAGTITAGNTAIGHLGHLSDAAEQLGNVDTGLPGNNLINTIKNGVQTASGRGLAATQFNNVLNKYVEEATKFYRGTGGTESDLQRDISNLNSSQSLPQLRTAIQTQAQLMQSKVDALQQRWHNGMGSSVPDFPVMQPNATAALKTINQRAGGAAPQTASAAPAPAAASASMPTLSDPSQVAKLASGTKFLTPDGRVGVAP